MNVQNLLLLANYLESLPADYEDFEMGMFHDVAETPFDAVGTHCGTAACAVGHAPQVEGLPKPIEGEGWAPYSERIFGVSGYSLEWDYMFSDSWDIVDNTPHGAAKRIRYIAEHGTVPKGWQYPILTAVS